MPALHAPKKEQPKLTQPSHLPNGFVILKQGQRRQLLRDHERSRHHISQRRTTYRAKCNCRIEFTTRTTVVVSTSTPLDCVELPMSVAQFGDWPDMAVNVNIVITLVITPSDSQLDQLLFIIRCPLPLWSCHTSARRTTRRFLENWLRLSKIQYWRWNKSCQISRRQFG